jgi:uncharacterized membrane protein
MNVSIPDPAGGVAAEPQILVGVSFDDLFRAQEFLTAAARLASRGEVKLRDAVIVAKDEAGHTHVKETIDPTPGRSALSGAMWTGLLGLLLGGPVGWAAGIAVGAGAGAVAAHVIDLGISDEWVAWFREAVQPGKATAALLMTDVNRDALVAEAARFTGARLVYANLEQHTLDRLADALGSATPVPSPAEPATD